MRVGTRITAAASALVATILSVYAFVEVRSAAADRQATLREQASHLASSVRAAIEAEGVDTALEHADVISREVTDAHPKWRVVILQPDGKEALSTEEAARMKALVEARPSRLVSEDDDVLIYTLPVRAPNRLAPEGFDVAGAVEVYHSIAPLRDAWRADLLRTLPLLALIVGLVVLAIMLLTRTVVSQPIEKLLAGIDDVAKGDLSRVLLSEREDEIGALASRFNEMTHSLRESQAETARQNQAKMKLEARLLKTEKLATIGQLAAEIAHEVGTPLNVIAGRARGLAKKAGDQEAVAKNAHIIAEQATRITRIIQRLLDLARRKVGIVEAEPVDVNEVCRATLDFLEGRLDGAGIKTDLDLAGDLPPVEGYPDQLQQVFLNLLINAIEAMPRGGKISLRTDTVTRRRPGLEAAPEQATVVVEITDTGSGIPDELRDRIFEPFYTSKDREGGTGLGLAVSYGIVKQSGGAIHLDSAPGEGTTFKIRFPPAEEEEHGGGETAGRGRDSRRRVSGTVLAIEDDPSVRRIVRRILQRAGIDVRLAPDAETGLEVLNEAGDEIEVVLTDLILPGMSGRELLEEVRDGGLDVQLVVMSGYDHDARGGHGNLPPDVLFIQKPFSPEALLEVLRTALGEETTDEG